jgi:hypothetical protein
MSKSCLVADMSPQCRRQAVAAILARGVLRYRIMAHKASSSADQESASSSENCLGPGAGSRPCVPAGSGGYGPRDPEKGRRV